MEYTRIALQIPTHALFEKLRLQHAARASTALTASAFVDVLLDAHQQNLQESDAAEQLVPSGDTP